ncbi:SDR family NAD(P)-dependent oxidoreductase [Sphingobacterium sp. UT-1RO-CII-1]|uniref:SDR family NAD(P)-dependent oxidoreductase n=1 Tax=Sphingobacterium sp. UT-1RO-CII-1 TaxID=2995225 RepID=UPI00227AE836|nr:SDR family NAD(P)-dependent oxidoreductase [Sphingobacterium sp. UT-1RO-CII-1]MCY4779587.1 SDR family NAD(P)-dependent oxidoreductase [Sphingobacterium sp. UT-1RO-CII-1]
MRTVLITGASSGIGEACAELLASENKYRLLLCARRTSKLLELKEKIIKNYPDCDIHVFTLDVRDQIKVKEAFQELPHTWQHIDVLINNAGLSQGLDLIQEASIDDWDRMIDTNLKGLLYVTKHCLPYMENSKNAHIINLGSIAGKEVYLRGNVYCATKHAVDALNKAMRIDLLEKGIKVSSVNPGMVETEFSEVRFKGDKNRAKEVYKDLVPLSAIDIAEIIAFILSRPAHVNINDLLVMPTAQATGTIVKREKE